MSEDGDGGELGKELHKEEEDLTLADTGEEGDEEDGAAHGRVLYEGSSELEEEEEEEEEEAEVERIGGWGNRAARGQGRLAGARRVAGVTREATQASAIAAAAARAAAAEAEGEDEGGEGEKGTPGGSAAAPAHQYQQQQQQQLQPRKPYVPLGVQRPRRFGLVKKSIDASRNNADARSGAAEGLLAGAGASSAAAGSVEAGQQRGTQPVVTEATPSAAPSAAPAAAAGPAKPVVEVSHPLSRGAQPKPSPQHMPSIRFTHNSEEGDTGFEYAGQVGGWGGPAPLLVPSLHAPPVPVAQPAMVQSRHGRPADLAPVAAAGRAGVAGLGGVQQGLRARARQPGRSLRDVLGLPERPKREPQSRPLQQQQQQQPASQMLQQFKPQPQQQQQQQQWNEQIRGQCATAPSSQQLTGLQAQYTQSAPDVPWDDMLGFSTQVCGG